MSFRLRTFAIVASLSIGLAGRAEAWPRRGCSDPCGNGYVALVGPGAYSCSPAGYAAAMPPCQPINSGPTTLLQVELVPTYVMEKRMVCTTEFKEEERQRVVTVPKVISVPEERYRVNTTMVPKTETKTIEYVETVPTQSTATKTYKIKVPVYRDVEETFTARVPVLKELNESYTAKVPVLRDVQFTYTVHVPYPVTTSVQRSVTSAVPVVKTRTISQCVPTQAPTQSPVQAATQAPTTNVARGHWENRMVEVATYSGRRRGCGCCTMVVCRPVWVPSCAAVETAGSGQQQTIEMEYLAYEQQVTTVPFECTSICFRPETRTGTKKEVTYEDQTFTRKRTVVDYVNESRKRNKKELSYQEETRTETYPVVTYTQEKKTKEVPYTTYVPESKVETYTAVRQDTFQEQRIENYTARVPIPVIKEVEVQVCKMVPKVVSVNVGSPCQGSPGYGYQPGFGSQPGCAPVVNCCR